MIFRGLAKLYDLGFLLLRSPPARLDAPLPPMTPPPMIQLFQFFKPLPPCYGCFLASPFLPPSFVSHAFFGKLAPVERFIPPSDAWYQDPFPPTLCPPRQASTTSRLQLANFLPLPECLVPPVHQDWCCVFETQLDDDMSRFSSSRSVSPPFPSTAS